METVANWQPSPFNISMVYLHI